MDEERKKEFIINRLTVINRKGMNLLINWMEDNGYFEAQASSRFHGNYKGGLVDHCLAIYSLLKEIFRKNDTEIEEKWVICSLLHDLCKLEDQSKGHSSLSIEIIRRFIELTPKEEMIIKFHMGVYGASGFYKEYSFSDLLSTWNNPEVKLFYFCDEIGTHFREKVI